MTQTAKEDPIPMKSRVLMVSNSSRVVGGGEISFWQLIKRLDRAHFEPVVVCPGKGPFCDLIEQLGTEYVLVDIPRFRGFGLFLLPRSVRDLQRLIKATRADLVHANGSRCMIAAGLAGLFARTPVLWHVRIIQRDGMLDWMLAALATKIAVSSTAVRKRFPKARPDKVAVVHNGVDMTEFRPDISGLSVREELGWSGLETIVTTVGRLEPGKGQRCFLEAAALVAQECNSARFLVVGEGDDRAELQALADRLGLKGLVKFTGARSDLPSIMAASNMVVSAAPSEGFGRSLVEAMATGKPVVATAGGGASDIVADGETGILIPPNDPAKLAQALLTLIEAPDEARLLGERGLARARECFTSEQHARRIEELYLGVLDGVRRKAR